VLFSWGHESGKLLDLGEVDIPASEWTEIFSVETSMFAVVVAKMRVRWRLSFKSRGKAEGTCLEQLSDRAELAGKPLQRQALKGSPFVFVNIERACYQQQRWRKFLFRRSIGIRSSCKDVLDGRVGIGELC
jgi:hypothetical protein